MIRVSLLTHKNPILFGQLRRSYVRWVPSYSKTVNQLFRASTL